MDRKILRLMDKDIKLIFDDFLKKSENQEMNSNWYSEIKKIYFLGSIIL